MNLGAPLEGAPKPKLNTHGLALLLPLPLRQPAWPVAQRRSGQDEVPMHNGLEMASRAAVLQPEILEMFRRVN